MDSNEKHIKAIREAIEAAFSDTDATVGPFEVRDIVESEWAAQNARTMRAVMEGRS
jgi:hypothetical protein